MTKNNSRRMTDDRGGTDRRLDAIIRLLMDGQRAQDKGKKLTKNEQVLILDSVGLTDAEIGRIVGWPAKDVGSKLSKLRKAKKNGKDE
jgi:hypothetical protein